MVTISSAGSTLTATGTSTDGPCSGGPSAKIVAITTMVAPGLGSPMKYFLSASGSTVTLKRASRKAAQASQKKRREPGEDRVLRQRPGVHEHGRREPEGDQVGEGVELDAEGGGRADQPGDRTVGDVEDDRAASSTAAQRELAAEGEQDRGEAARHVAGA